MSMDQRIETKHPPMFGCHSDLDKYRKGDYPQTCDYSDEFGERGCDGCTRAKQAENG